MRMLTFVLICTVFLSAVLQADGLLQDVREEVKKERKPNASTNAGSQSSSSTAHSHASTPEQTLRDIEDLGRFFAFLGAALTSPFWAPHQAFDKGMDTDGFFRDYPYADKSAGYMHMSSNSVSCRNTAWRIALEDGYDFEGVNSLTANLLFSSTSRMGFEVSLSHLSEALDDATYDTLRMGKVNLTFRFVQNPRVQMRTGIGFRFMNDPENDGDTENGFNFTYQADLYPEPPFVISAAIDIGTLGEANVINGRFTVGTVRNGWELYGGYNSLRVGAVEINGPLFGIRRWM